MDPKTMHSLYDCKEVWEEILKQVERDRTLLADFTRTYDTRLEDIVITSERAPEIPYEAMYFFSDGLGGYTIGGIINSLNEYNK